jgi:hypothetical protein
MNRDCTYCRKPHRGRAWLGLLGTLQCDRLWCRLRSGHLMRMHGLQWKSFTITIPYIGRWNGR